MFSRFGYSFHISNPVFRYHQQFSLGGAVPSLNQIWWALAAFMGTQVVTGILRYNSATGVWKILKGEKAPEAA